MKKLSLFSGIGGDDLASEWAGIETVCFVEKDKYCQRVLRRHWPNVPIIEDVKDVTKDKLRDITGYETVDIVAGGYPCQGESVAGNRKGADDYRWLWPEMCRIIHEVKPCWVLGENVANHINMGLSIVLSDLEGANYEAQSFCIPAYAVKACHKRARYLTVAHSNEIRCDLRQFEGERILWQNQTRHEVNSSHKSSDFDSSWELQPQGSFKDFRRWDGYGSWPIWVEAASEFCRVDDGLPNKLDRIAALGNAVVPQQIYPIYKAIVEIEAVRQATRDG